MRIATPAENLRNSRKAIGKGAFFDRQTRKWFTRISWDGRRVMLGRFRSEEDAHEAIALAKAFLKAGGSLEECRIMYRHRGVRFSAELAG